MNVDQTIGKNTKIARVQVSVLICSFLLLLPRCLVAQTVPSSQALPQENAGYPSQVMPKWIKTATVDLVFKDTDMVTILDKIHEQTGITILREGFPIKAAADLSFHGPLKDALDQIADAFDYTWAPSKKLNKALLFNKRFRSPEEHPEWREKEMLHVSEQVCRALQSPLAISEPYGNTRDLLHLLYHKLSPEQLQFLYQGGQLSFQDLNATQTLLLNQQIYSVALGGVNEAWQRLQSRLAHLKEAKLVFRDAKPVFRTVGVSKTLTLVFPPSVDGTPDSVIVRYYTDADITTGAADAPESPLNLEGTEPLSVQVDTSQNAEQTTLQRRVDVRMQGGRLKDLLREVSQRSRCKITVPDYLQEQSLSLWTKGCSVRLLLDLLAEQNEWEWTYTASKGRTIVYHDTFVPTNLAEVSAAFQVAMPPGYRHYLGLGIAPDDWLKGDEDPQTKFYSGLQGGNMMSMRRKASRKAGSDDYDDPVMLRIWPTPPQKFFNHEELAYNVWTPRTKASVLGSLFAIAIKQFFDNRGFDVISGRLTPYEMDAGLVRLQLDGLQDGQYHVFGYSYMASDPNYGITYTPAFFWTLKNASAPLSPNLEEISKRY